MHKVVTAKNVSVYLSLISTGATVNTGIKGVKVILSNDQVLSFPNQTIDVDVSDNGYEYTAFITLTKENLALLKKYTVVKWKLYIYEGSQDPTDAEAFRIMVNCMDGMK